MSQSIQISIGSKLELNTTGSTWVEIGEIQNMDGPSKSRKDIPLPALADTVTYRTVGRADYGQFTFTIGMTASGFNFINAYFVSKDLKNYRITDPDTSTETFAAFVMSITRSFPDDEKITADVTLAITGASTYTPTGS